MITLITIDNYETVNETKIKCNNEKINKCQITKEMMLFNRGKETHKVHLELSIL